MKTTQNSTYEEQLSDFMFETASKLGGGLPTDYFNPKELVKLEKIFKKVYTANTEMYKLIDTKMS